MKHTPLWILATFIAMTSLWAAGPYSPESWPATIDKTKTVHYVVTDPGLDPPSATWTADGLSFLTGGDQVTIDYCVKTHASKKVTGQFLNVLDSAPDFWADKDTINILVQVYGDASLYAADGSPRNFNFLEGALPNITAPVGGQIPVGALNKQWNWVLFSVTNALDVTGERYVRGPGVNGGTIRFEQVPNLIVRVIAFGEAGAFGTKGDINVFSAGAAGCDPPPTNLAGIDLNAGTTNHIVVLNNVDQLVNFVNDVGPASDKRKAVVPQGHYLNFAIMDNYLGQACADPTAVKLCIDFYDDPAFAGLDVHFGPEAYALDAGSCTTVYPAVQLAALTGSGAWVHRSWTVPAVSLKGINAGTLTAGPRLISVNGQVAVSQYQIAVLRTTGPLANQDPLSTCAQDENICKGVYGDYAQLDLGQNIKDGLDLGSSGGDQEYITGEAGSASDRRQAVWSAQGDGTAPFDSYVNFQITDQKLGPTSQDPALLAICVTYYDDPTLTNSAPSFRPDVYSSEKAGQTQYAFPPAANYTVHLQKSGKWLNAYFEIPDMNFAGVNQGPQAAARFTFNDKIPISRVQYAVLRPCGPTAGVNLLQSCKPVQLTALRAGNQVQISWPTNSVGWTLQQNTVITNTAAWTAVTTAPVVENGRNVVKETLGAGPKFYRPTQ
jgi:hypothetical protein